MTNKSNSESNKFHFPDELRPASRSRLTQQNARMLAEHHGMHGHVPGPPSVPQGFNRPKMDKPRVNLSNSGHTLDHEGHPLKDNFRAANPAPGGNNAFRLPEINPKGNYPYVQKDQRVADLLDTASKMNGNFQLPNLKGKTPAPPEIPRARHFAHSHNVELKTAHPGRRFKSMACADHTVIAGLKPVPPPKPTDYAPSQTTRKLTPPEAQAFQTREKIMISPSELRVVSPASIVDNSSYSHHELIRSPSSLVDVTNTASDHLVQGSKRRQPSLIDVNVPPTAQGNDAIKSVADRRKKRPRRF